ncbi:adenosylcobinamide-phosphate synthase [Clostridium algifaecis]|uniref:Cobalamin biosynthesis protein CobD n=2 Tax=Clostridium algifaecis TaxID=1472040 RepID=A0ABS4KR61_9CLOT|nr:adenosylcobinamide-phosphate synthase [Clostridium algifaecis]
MAQSFIIMNLIDVVAAVLLDLIIGDPTWFPHPVIFMGKLVSFLEKRGRQLFKSEIAIKTFGGIIVLIMISISFSIPFAVLYIFKTNILAFNIINTVLLCTALSARCLSKEAKKVYCSLEKNDIEDARVKLSYIVGRDTQNLNKDEITRAVVETVAENTSDGVIAPLFYGIIFGAPLAMMYKAVNTMDSMLGYMNEKYRHIGFFPAKVDDIFNLIPARITGVLMCIAAPAVGGNILETVKIMVRDRKNHKSPNCAYPEAAAAGAMGVKLGGTNIYFGEIVYKPTLGDEKVKLDFSHINNCIKLMYLSETIMVIAAAVLTYGIFKEVL